MSFYFAILRNDRKKNFKQLKTLMYVVVFKIQFTCSLKIIITIIRITPMCKLTNDGALKKSS